MSLKKKSILLLSLFLFMIPFFFPAPPGLDENGFKTLIIFVICVIWWVTNIVPLMITSILAIISLPMLGIEESSVVYSRFGNTAVFFVLGSFILGSAIMRTGLSTRIALAFTQRLGRSPKRLIIAFQLLATLLAFWISGHAVAAMLMPIIIEVGTALYPQKNGPGYSRALAFSVMWGAVIGSCTTLLGGARGPLALAMLDKLTGREISFGGWVLATLPVVTGTTIAASLILLKITPGTIDIKSAVELLREKRQKLGGISGKEKAVLTVILLTTAAWFLFSNRFGLANIALLAVVVLFIFEIISWKEVEEDVNWGVILMYGGAIALGYSLNASGVAEWLVNGFMSSGISSPVMILATLALISVLFTEFMSNTAVVAFLLPVALSGGILMTDIPELIVFAVTIPSGLAFMLPMSTPAVAMMLSTGYIEPRDTMRYGIFLNITGTGLTILSLWLYWPLLFG